MYMELLLYHELHFTIYSRDSDSGPDASVRPSRGRPRRYYLGAHDHSMEVTSDECTETLDDDWEGDDEGEEEESARNDSVYQESRAHEEPRTDE